MTSDETIDDSALEVDAFERMLDESVAVSIHRARRWVRHQTRQERQQMAEFRQIVDAFWGISLDRYLATLIRARSLGDQFNRRNRKSAVESNDLVFEALVLLHARACRSAAEAHILLEAGHADGAWLHGRILYELACTSSVISEYGRRPEHADLAERFLLHVHREAHDDLLNYQTHSERLQMAPFSEEHVAASKAAVDDLIDRFGKAYFKSYGWAAGLPGWSRNEFAYIAKLAGLDHRLPYWRLASHQTHATSKGAQLNRVATRHGPVLQVGASSAGLAEPASDALISLYQCTVSLVVFGAPEPAVEDIIEIQTISALLDSTQDALMAANAALERDILTARRREGSVRRFTN